MTGGSRSVATRVRTVRRGIRGAIVAVLDRLGLRHSAQRLYLRWWPSRSVRRDRRDHELLRALIASALGGNRLGVDVGANVGAISRMMFDVAPDTAHVLVEPVPHLAEQLAVRFPLAEVHQVVCGATPGVVDFSIAVDMPTRSSLDVEMASSGGRVVQQRIPQVALDELLGDRAPALVKVDVEGAELDVLKGMEATLQSKRPLLVFEHMSSPTGDTTASAEIFGLLTGAGYTLFDIDGIGPMTADSFVETVTQGRTWTFLAVPASR